MYIIIMMMMMMMMMIVIIKTARACALPILHRYLGSPRACLRRIVCTQALIG